MTLRDDAPHVAVVTGASRGIGRAITERLASAGIMVLATARSLRPGDGRYPGSLEETVERVRERGGRAAAMAVDLSDPDFDRDLILQEAAHQFGAAVDIVVNNAAAERRFEVTFAQMTGDLFREVVEVNVWAGWDLARRALPGMMSRGAGWIVNITSRGAAPRPGPPYVLHPLIFGQCLYGGTKAMVDRLTTGAAAELYEHDIAVNALAPEGAVATQNAVTVARVDPSRSEPLETMAEATLALCSGDPRVLTGRVTYSLSLLVELGRSVRTLDGTALVPGWQPSEIDPTLLSPGYLVTSPR
jgi:NAD(P)-dependent dehydrogenase (short-subunit alcohol dehydrogenase family)